MSADDGVDELQEQFENGELLDTNKCYILDSVELHDPVAEYEDEARGTACINCH